MRKRAKRLAYLTIVTGIVIVGLLLFAVNRGPVTRGFEPVQPQDVEAESGLRAYCPWCGTAGPVDPIDVAGTVLIGTVLLAFPAGHIALLIMLARHVSRPPRFADIEPAFRCPACNHPLVKQWHICPYCGRTIKPPAQGTL